MARHVVIELGGNISRLAHACRVANAIPNSYLIVSTESDPERCLQIAQTSGLPRHRIYLDYRAWDTVTNFTKTFSLVKRLDATDLHIVTDGFHMRRSMGIARIVYWMRGIRLTAQPSSIGDPEPWKLTREDWLRALYWRLTGKQHIWRDVYERRWPAICEQAKIAARL